jgi:hypothetical protein
MSHVSCRSKFEFEKNSFEKKGEILFLIHISSTTMKAASAMYRHGGARNKAGKWS